MEAVLVLLLLLASEIATSFSDNTSEPKSIVFQTSEKFIGTASRVYHMELDLYKNDSSILFADRTAIKTTTEDKIISTIVSGFTFLAGFKQLNSTHLAAIDYYAHCVKMVSRDDNSVSVLAGQCGNSGLFDGNPGQFNSPYAVEEDVQNPGKLLVTDEYNHALRSVDINTGIVHTVISSGFNWPKGMTWNGNVLLVTNENYISEVVWSGGNVVTNTILAGSMTRGNADGDFSLSRFSYPIEFSLNSKDRYLIADANNRKLRLLDISRRLVLPVCVNSLSLCTESTDMDWPLSVLTTADAVYVGQDKKISKLTEKIIYSTTPELTTTPTLVCKTRNITVTLQEGEFKADVEVFSGKWGKLGLGVHEYTDMSAGNCTVIINVVRSTSSKTTCPESIIRVASSDTKTAAVEIPSAKLELSIGKHSLNIPYNSATCNLTIDVIDPNIRRRVTFQADYDVKCAQATAAVAKAIIFSTAQQHFEQIKRLCGKYCKPIVTKKPIITCANDKLRIQWPTNPVYGGEVLEMKLDVKSALKQQVSGITLANFRLVVPSKTPPVVYPVKNSDGNALTFSLTPFCVGNLTYIPLADRCL